MTRGKKPMCSSRSKARYTSGSALKQSFANARGRTKNGSDQRLNIYCRSLYICTWRERRAKPISPANTFIFFTSPTAKPLAVYYMHISLTTAHIIQVLKYQSMLQYCINISKDELSRPSANQILYTLSTCLTRGIELNVQGASMFL